MQIVLNLNSNCIKFNWNKLSGMHIDGKYIEKVLQQLDKDLIK